MVTLAESLSLLPWVELQSMRCDGEVFFCAGHALTNDDRLTATLKTELVCRYDPDRLILSGYSALWAAGGCSEPLRHEVSLRAGTRPRTATEDHYVVREQSLAPEDVIEHTPYGARLTEHRALLDVLRLDDRSDQVVAEQCARTSVALGIDIATIRQRLSRETGIPYRTRALRRLSLVDAIHVVDAIDSSNRVENTLEVTRVTGLEDKATQR